MAAESVRQHFFQSEVPFGQIIYDEAKKNDLPPELVAAVAGHRGDDGLGARERLAERFGAAAPDVQDRHLEDRVLPVRVRHWAY